MKTNEYCAATSTPVALYRRCSKINLFVVRVFGKLIGVHPADATNVPTLRNAMHAIKTSLTMVPAGRAAETEVVALPPFVKMVVGERAVTTLS